VLAQVVSHHVAAALAGYLPALVGLSLLLYLVLITRFVCAALLEEFLLVVLSVSLHSLGDLFTIRLDVSLIDLRTPLVSSFWWRSLIPRLKIIFVFARLLVSM